MISRLRIQNFKSYEDETIEFGEGLNVIVPDPDAEYPNDIGKTNIIHALRWLLFGQGVMEFCIRDRTKPMVVEAQIDQHTISRVKHGPETYYLIDNTQKILTKKGEVPPEVQAITKMPLIDVYGDGDPVRVHLQYPNEEGSFLIFDSSSKLERAFNTLFGSEDAERILKLCISDKSSILRSMNDWERECRELDERITALSWVDLAHQRLQEIEDKRRKRDQLASLYEEIKLQSSAQREAAVKLEKWSTLVQTCVSLRDSIENKLEVLGRLSAILELIEKVESEQKFERSVVNSLNEMERQLIEQEASEVALRELLESERVCPYCARPAECPHCGKDTYA